MSNKTEQPLRCSFCGRRENQAPRLIAGPGVYICAECVDACKDLLRDEYDLDEGISAPEHLPTPMEIKSFMDQYIIGQDEAVSAVTRAIKRNRAGVSYKRKPDRKSVV